MAQARNVDIVAWSVAAAALLLHAAFANSYGVFRDELYFIECGRHPDFGYVDQPPIVPLISAALYALGAQTWLLRLPCLLFAALLPWLGVKFTRLLGGKDGAAWIAGVACVIAPMLMGLMATLSTTVFEPVAWTAIACFVARAAILGDKKALIWAGVVAGLALEAKYAIVLWFVALAVGLLATPERRLIAKPRLWIGSAIGAVIAAPSLIWQAAHDWPFLELAHAAADKNAHYSPPAFVLNQILVMNPLLALLWITGAVAPFFIEALKPARFLSIAFVATLALTILTQGKDYYTAAAYPSMFVTGAVALERIVRWTWARTAYLALAAALSALVAPLALPILPPSQISPYMAALGVAPQQQERSFAGTALPNVFADQLGWRDFVDQVGAAWRQIPAADRAHTAIKVDNYGEASALDVLGAGQFPPALTGHNQYFLWGLRGQHPTNLLVVQKDVERLRPYCDETVVLGETHSPYAMAYENGNVIAFCRNVHPSPETIWPDLKSYQ
jgi:4-amino-4-deoxy-L-arabinose transferase-like glycosyltransferase